MKRLALAKVRQAVIVAPHPDDEVIGAYGLIRALRATGTRVRVVVVTDGTGSHPDSARWPARKLATRRRNETLSALHGIRVFRSDVTFLGLPDGGLSGIAVKQALALRRAIARTPRCDLLVMPARDDDHPDHRAVAAIVRRTPTIKRRFEYLVWPSRKTRSRRATHRLSLGAGAAAKRGAILRYRSQTGAITDDPGGFAISRAELAAFSHPVERFRAVSR